MVSAAAFRLSMKNNHVFCLSINMIDSETKSEGKPALETMIPADYHEYLPLFSESEADTLPSLRPGFDHKIELEPDSKPPFGPIYSLSQIELKTLHDYIQENL